MDLSTREFYALRWFWLKKNGSPERCLFRTVPSIDHQCQWPRSEGVITQNAWAMKKYTESIPIYWLVHKYPIISIGHNNPQQREVLDSVSSLFFS